MAYDLFIIEGEKFFYSPSLVDRMQPLLARREAGRKAGVASGKARSERLLNVGSTLVEQVKESKVKESKEREPHNSVVRGTLSKVLKYFSVQPKTAAEQGLWLDEIEKLNRIDSVPFDEMVKVIIHTRQDDFWAKNFLSLRKIRRRDKDGVMFYEKFKANMNRNPKQNYKTTEDQGFY
jgi:hypothetical protein